MSTRDDQEERGAGAAPRDESWKQHFPQAHAAGAARDEYKRTAEARRIEAERAATLEAARQAKVEDLPTPSGEGDNPHENEPEVPKHETAAQSDVGPQGGDKTVREGAADADDAGNESK